VLVVAMRGSAWLPVGGVRGKGLLVCSLKDSLNDLHALAAFEKSLFSLFSDFI